MGTWLAFPATKSNSVEIPYINYKNLRYTFDKFTEKIDGRVLVPSPMLSLVISSASFNIFSETFHNNLPVARAKQLGWSMKKTASCKKKTELPG